MCGRYDNLIARDAYRGLFKANRLPKSNFPLRYNIAPTDQIPIVRIDIDFSVFERIFPSRSAKLNRTTFVARVLPRGTNQ
jgi:putative SOS response-associated peptidase YedK